MKTLIVYASNRNSMGSIVMKMKEALGENTIHVNLNKQPNPSVKDFQRIIIGGSVFAGQINKKVAAFCSGNIEELQEKELGLFVACTGKGEAANWQLTDAFPEELRVAAKSTAVFSGMYDSNPMNFLRKLIVRKGSGSGKNNGNADYRAVQEFSRRMDRIFNPFLFLA